MNKKLDLEVGIIKNVYDSSSINKIRENILYKYNDNLPSKNIFNLETYLFDMVFNDVSVNYFKNILQEFVLLPENTLSIGKFNVAHRDTTSFEAGGLKIHYDKNFQMYTIGMYLQDNSNKNGGGIFVVPNSYLFDKDKFLEIRQSTSNNLYKRLTRFLKLNSFEQQYNETVNKEGLENNGFDVLSNVGDLTYFDVRSIHRGSHRLNNSKEKRIAIFSRIIKKKLRSHK